LSAHQVSKGRLGEQPFILAPDLTNVRSGPFLLEQGGGYENREH
jgi:hypothetical protein